MDQQAGDILRRRRYQNLPTAPIPLGNGIIDPAPVEPTAFDIDARVDWYGQVMVVQEQVNAHACYKSALIEVELCYADNTAQALLAA